MGSTGHRAVSQRCCRAPRYADIAISALTILATRRMPDSRYVDYRLHSQTLPATKRNDTIREARHERRATQSVSRLGCPIV